MFHRNLEGGGLSWGGSGDASPASGAESSSTKGEQGEPREIDLNRGMFVQERDREAASKIRGEQLTEEQFAARAERIKELRTALLDWIAEHVPDEQWDQRSLKAMTDYLSREHAETIDVITKGFMNREMYPKRPVVKLMLREIGRIPDVFLFGWRGQDAEQWDRETKIHDHADSSVALTVHAGAVDETVYVVDTSHLKTTGTQRPDNPRGHQRIKLLDQHTRTYPAGASKTYRSPPPYLHTVAGSPDHDLTVTVHAYLRPSEEIAYDFTIDKEHGELVEIGVS